MVATDAANRVFAMREPWRTGALGTSRVLAPGRMEGHRLTTPFETALGTAETSVTGYFTTALPVVAAVAVAFLGVKYVRRIIKSL